MGEKNKVHKLPSSEDRCGELLHQLTICVTGQTECTGDKRT